MCGIFGLSVPENSQTSNSDLKKQADLLFKLSETRGKEAAGIAFQYDTDVMVLKRPQPASKFIKEKEYKSIFQQLNGASEKSRSFIGHSRLVTNGMQAIPENNQPVCKSQTIGVHNGIIVNDEALWENHPQLQKTSELDSEVIISLIDWHIEEGKSFKEAVKSTFKTLEGSASVAVLYPKNNNLILATNTGSCYYIHDKEYFAFTSEAYTLKSWLSELGFENKFKINHLKPGRGLIHSSSTGELSEFAIDEVNDSELENPPQVTRPVSIQLRDNVSLEARAKLKRCTKCVLPETMPYIVFDEKGVCNYCNEHEPLPYKGMDELKELCDKYRSKDGSPDCLVSASGGRDSCYGLHFVKKELGLNPIAYTYDWGMVTDIARRNQARVCGKLGIEHIIVSADIKEKRKNIKRNVEAWMKRPQLGMIPLFMAGDKQYFYFADQVRKQNNVTLTFFFGNPYERTNFKSGFTGVKQSTQRLYDVSVFDKFRVFGYYAKELVMNYSYWNSSLFDTLFAFYSSYMMKHDFVWPFNYIPWDEQEIDRVLKTEYGWETAADTDSTWRIGDGTAAFYNYIYYTVAGFTEHDTFRSNQIREGILDRESALKMVNQENETRWPSVKEYCQIVGIDFDEVVETVESMPKLY